MSFKFKYFILITGIYALFPLPGAVANLCGCSFEVLGLLTAIPGLLLALMASVCTPISMGMLFHAIVCKQWKEAALLMMSLFFPLATLCAMRLLNRPGFESWTV